jgi:hypothetical protein
MHPTQHTTHQRPRAAVTEPRILRTHRLITRGTSEANGDAFVQAAVEGLLSLSKQPATRLHIAPAPIRPDLVRDAEVPYYHTPGCHFLNRHGKKCEKCLAQEAEWAAAKKTLNQEAA